MSPRDSLFSGILQSIQTAFEEDDALYAGKAYELSHIRTIQRQIEAIGAADYGSFAAELHPDVVLEIHAPTMFPWVRRARGRDQVKAAVIHNFATVEAQAPQVFAVVAQGNVVDMTLRELGRLTATQQPYDVTAVQQFIFRQGQVVRFREIVALTTHEE